MTIDLEQDEAELRPASQSILTRAADVKHAVSASDDDSGDIVGTLVGIYLNDSALERLFAVGDSGNADRDFFCRRVLPALNSIARILHKAPFRCVPSDVALQRPIPLLTERHGLHLTLFDYQRRCVRYMLNVEQKSRTAAGNVSHVPTSKNVMFRHLDTAFNPDVAPGRLPPCVTGGHLASVNLPRATTSPALVPLDVRGGVLAARTGTGKTTTTIALIYIQHRFDAALGVQRRPRRAHDGPTFPLHRLPPLYCAVNGSVLARYYTPATLVVAPRQVVRQWADEFEKTLVGTPLRVHVIRGANDIAALSIHKLMTAIDVLIVNKAIFKSTAYRQVRVNTASEVVSLRNISFDAAKTAVAKSSTTGAKVSKAAGSTKLSSSKKSAKASSSARTDGGTDFAGQKYTYWPTDDAFIDQVIARDRAAAERCPAGKEYQLGSIFYGVLLHAMHFERVIIDEAHELDSHWSMLERAVASLRSNVTWLLTATPNFDSKASFATLANGNNAETLIGYPALICAPHGARDLTSSDMVRWYFAQRNCITASTVVGMPPLVLHRRNVLLDATEMAIYMSVGSRRRQVEFCSHHNVDNEHWQQLLRDVNSNDDNDVDNLDEHLSIDRALSVEEVAASMQAARKRRLDTLTAQVEAMETAIADAQRNVVDPLLDAHPLLGRVWHLQHQQPMALFEALAYQTTLVQRVDTLARLIAADHSATDGDDSGGQEPNDADVNDNAMQETTIAVGYNNERRGDNGGADDADDDVHGDLQAHRAAAIAWRLEQREVHNLLQQGSLSATFANDEERLSAANHLQRLIEDLREQRRALQPQQQQLHAVRREYNFFEGVLRRLVVDPAEESEPLTCPICLEGDSMRQALALTACGHEMCCECAKQHFARRRICPICHTRLRLPDDLRNVNRLLVTKSTVSTDGAGAQQQSEAQHSADANRPGSRYGSKIAALLQLIGEIRERRDFAKMIVYAQFERLLAQVAAALREFGLDFEYARGSIDRCEKAMRRFKNDNDVRILLLSSESSISGVHLVEANHLIAIHPPLGASVEQAYAKHWQAIGRIRRLVQKRTCHVWSLITQGTIEATMYDEQLQHARGKHINEDNIDWVGDERRERAADGISDGHSTQTPLQADVSTASTTDYRRRRAQSVTATLSGDRNAIDVSSDADAEDCASADEDVQELGVEEWQSARSRRRK